MGVLQSGVRLLAMGRTRRENLAGHYPRGVANCDSHAGVLMLTRKAPSVSEPGLPLTHSEQDDACTR